MKLLSLFTLSILYLPQAFSENYTIALPTDTYQLDIEMAPLKNVVVVGGSGNLGVHVVRELLAADFNVTVLSRASSTASFPAGVAVRKVDFESAPSLEAALAGQDAVVSTVATAALGVQQRLADAAVAARVQRFIPSEFGINTRLVGDRPIGKILAGKVALVDDLAAKAKANPWFSWTGISTGFFFDWGLEVGFLGYDIAGKKATVVDSGNEKWQASTLPHVGKTVAAVLAKPEQTANQYLESSSFTVSQAEVVRLIEELSGVTLAVTRQDSAELQKTGEDKLARGDYSAFGELVRVWNYADGAGHAVHPAERADARLGVPEDDLKATIKAWLAKAGALKE